MHFGAMYQECRVCYHKCMKPVLIVIILSLVGVIGDFFIKIAGNGQRYIEYRWFVIGFLIYASTAFGWFYVMKEIKLSVLGVIYALSTVLFLAVAGVGYFHENLAWYELVGIGTAILSILLLARFA